MPKKEASVSGFLSDNTESSIHGSILNSNNSFSPNLSIENETVLQDTSSISLQHLDNLSFYERVRTSANESDLSSIFSRGSLNGKQLKKIKRKPSDLSNRSALKKKLDDSNSDDSSSSINVSNIDDSFFKRPKDPGPKSPFSKSQRKSIHSKVSLDSSNETLDTKKNVRKKSPRKNKSQANTSRNISVNLNSDSSSGSIDLSIIEMAMAKISSSPTKDFSPKRYGKTSPRKKSNRKRKLTELLDIGEVFNVPSLDRIKVDPLLQSPNLDETNMSEKSEGKSIINKKSLASQRVSVKLLESFFDSENENQDSVISPVKTLHMTKNCTLADFTFSESGSMNSFEGSISDSVDKKPKDDSITNERRKNLTSDLQINEATIPEALECNESSINNLTKELGPKKGLASHRVSVKLSEVLDDSELYDGTSVSFTRRTRKSLANSTVPDNDSNCSIKNSISDRGKSQKLSVQLSFDDSVTEKKKMSSENCKSNEIQDNLDKPDQSNQPQLGYESIQQKPRKSILRKNTRKSTVGNGASQPSEGYGGNIEEYNNLANDKKKNLIKTRKSSVQFKLDSSQTEDSNKNQTSKSILRRSTRKSVTFSTELSNLNEVHNEKEGNEVQKNKNTDKKINLTNARQSCMSEIDMELTNQDKTALSDYMDLTLKKSFTSQKVSVIAAENESSKNNSNFSSLKNVSNKCDINLGNDLESDTILTDHKRDDNDDSPNQFIQKAKVPLVKRKSSVHFELDETENNIINYTNVDEIHNTDHMNTMEEYAALGLTLSGKSYTTSIGIEMKEFTKSELTTNSGDANHHVDPGECNNLSVNDSLLDAMDVYMNKIKQKNVRSSNAALDGQGKSIQKINAITEQTINTTSELCEIQKLKKCSLNETQLSNANSSITKSIFNGSSFDEDLPSSTLIENSRSALISDKIDLLPDKKKNITSEMGDRYTLGQEDKSLNCMNSIEVKDIPNDSDMEITNKTQGQENLSILDDVSLTVDESVRSVTRKAAGKRASVHFNFDTTGADDETIGNNQNSQTSHEQNNTQKSVKSKGPMGQTMNSIEVKDIHNDSDMEITNKTQGQENLSLLDDVSLTVDESVRSVTRKAAGKRASVHFNFDTTGADDETIGNNQNSQTSHEQNNTQKSVKSKGSMGQTMNSIEVKDIPNDSDMEITNKTQGQENLSILDDVSLTVDESVRSVTRKAAGKRASVHFNFDTTGADDETIGNNQNSETSHEQNNTQKSVKSKGSMGLTMNSIEVKDIPNDSDMEITNKTQGQENLSILDDVSLTVDESVRSVTRKAAGKRASVHFNFDTTGADDETIGNNQNSQTSHEQNNTQKSVKSKGPMGQTMNSIEVKDIHNDSDMEITNKTQGQENLSLLDDVSLTVDESVRSVTRKAAGKRASVHFNFDTTGADDETIGNNQNSQTSHEQNNTQKSVKSKGSMGQTMNSIEVKDIPNDSDMEITNKTQGQENLSILDDVSLTVDESVRSVTRKAAGKRASVHFNFDTTGADDETIGNNQNSETSHEQNNTQKSVKSKGSMGLTMNSIEVKDIPNDSDMEITNKTQGQENLSISDDVSLDVDESVSSVTRKAAGKRASVHLNFDTTGADDETIGNNQSSQTSHEQKNTQQPLQSKESMGPSMNSIEVKDIPNDSDMEITNKTQGQENLSISDDVSLDVDESVRSVTRKAAGKRASVHFNFDTTGADDETIGNNQNSQTSYEQNNTQKSVKSKESMGPSMNSIELKDIPNNSDMEITNKIQGEENLSLLDDVSLNVDESVRSVTRKAAGKRPSVHFNFDTTGADDETIGNNQSSQTSYEQNNTQKSVKSKESMGPSMNSIEVKDIPNDSDMEITNKTQGQENLSISDDVSLDVDESVRSVTRKAAGKRPSVHFNFDTTGADDETIGNNQSSQTSYEQNNTQKSVKSKESMGPSMNSIELKDIPNNSDMEITNKIQGEENLSLLDDVSLNVDESVRSVTRKAAGKRPSVHFNFDTTGADDETIGNNQSSQTSYEQNNTQKSVKSKESIGLTMNSIEVKDIPNDSDMEITNKTQGQENLSILDDVSLTVDESVRSVTRKAAGKRASGHFNFDTTEGDDETIGNNLNSQTSHEQNNTQKSVKSKGSMGLTMNSIEVKDIHNDSDMEITNKTQGQENLSISDDLSLNVDESVRSVTRKAAGKRASVHFNFDTTGADDETIGNNLNSQTSHEQNNTQKSMKSKGSMGLTMNSIEVKDIPNDSDMEITNKTQGQENLSILDDVSLNVDESVRSVSRKAAGKRASGHFNFDTTEGDDETIGNNLNSQTSHDQNNTQKSVKSKGSMGPTMNSTEVKDIPNDSDIEITNKTQGQENLSISDDGSLNVDESVRSVSRKAAGKRASVHSNFDTTGADDETIGNNQNSQTSHEQNNTQKSMKSKGSMGLTMNSIEVKDIPNDSDMEITNKTQGQENLSILDDVSLNVDESVSSVTRNAAEKRASVHFNFDTTGADDNAIGNNQRLRCSHEQNNAQETLKTMGSSMNLTEIRDVKNDSDMEITNNMSLQENLTVLDDVSLNVDESVRSVSRNAAKKRASVHFNFDTTGAVDDTIGNNQSGNLIDDKICVHEVGSVEDNTSKAIEDENLFLESSDSILLDYKLTNDVSVNKSTKNTASNRVSVHFALESSETDDDYSKSENSISYRESLSTACVNIINESEFSKIDKNLSLYGNKSVDNTLTNDISMNTAALKRVSVHFALDNSKDCDDFNNTLKSVSSRESSVNDTLSNNTKDNLSLEGVIYKSFDTKFTNDIRLNKNRPKRRVSINLSLDNSEADNDLCRTENLNTSKELSQKNTVNDLLLDNIDANVLEGDENKALDTMFTKHSHSEDNDLTSTKELGSIESSLNNCNLTNSISNGSNIEEIENPVGDNTYKNLKENVSSNDERYKSFDTTMCESSLTDMTINADDELEIRPGRETISESRNEPLKENVEGSISFKTTIIDEVSENNKEKINRHVSIGNVFEDTSVRPALTEQEINSSDVLEIRPDTERTSESRNEPLKENVEGSISFKTTIIDEVSENNKEKINRHVSIGNVFEDTSVRPALTEQEINSSDVLEIRPGKETSESRNEPLKENVEGSMFFKTTIIDEVSENNKEKINRHVSIGKVFEDTSVRPALTEQEINSSDVLEIRPDTERTSESRNEPLKENVEGSMFFKTTIIDEVSENNKEKINRHVSIGHVFEDTSVRPALTEQEINSSDVLEIRPGKETSESRNEPLKENVEGSMFFKTTIIDEVSENNKEKINRHVSIGNVFEDTSVRPALTEQEINSSDVLEIRPDKETCESRNEPLKENVEGSISFKTTIIDEVSENNREKINRHVSIGNVFEDTSVRPALTEQEINSSDVLEIRPDTERTSESRNEPLKENVEGSMFFKTTIIDQVSENNKEKINRYVSIGNVFEDISVRPALTEQEINSSDVLEIRPDTERTSESRNEPLKENVEGSMFFKTTIIDEVSENNKEKINRHVSIGNVFEDTSVRPALTEQEINSSDVLEIRPDNQTTSESRNEPLKENVEGSMFFKTTIIDDVSENNKEKINRHVSIGKVFEDTSVRPSLTDQEINSSDDVLEIRPGKETISETIKLTKMSGDKETLNFNKSLVRFDKEYIPTENVNESIVPKLYKEVEPNDNMNKKQSSYVKVGHGESSLQHIINESTISNIDRSILQSDRSKIKSSKENITNRSDSMNSECENTEYNDKKKNIHVSVGIKFDDTSVQHTMTDFTTFSKNTSDSQQNDYSSQAMEEMKSKTINILTKNIPNEIHVGSSMDKMIDQNADGEKNRHVSVTIAFDETSIQRTINDFVTFNTDTITSLENDNSKLKLKFIQPNRDLPTETEYSANENVGSTTLQIANELFQNNQGYKNCHVSEGVLFNETSCQPDSTTSDPLSSLLQEQPLINITKSSAIVSESLVNKDSNQSKFVDKLSVLNESNSGDSSESNFTLFLEKDDSPAHSNLEINETPTKNVICDNLRCSNLKINHNSGEAFIEPEISCSSKIRRNLDDETQSAIPEMYQGPCLYKDLTEPMTLSKPAFISDVLHSDLVESNGLGDSLNLNSIDSNVNRQNESLHCNKSVDNTANEILNNDLNKTEGKPVIVSDKSFVRITRSSLKKSDSSSTSVLTKNNATVLEKSEASCAVINSSSNKIKRKLSGLDFEHSFSPKKVILDISDHLQPPSLCDSDKITEPDIMPLKSNSFENLSHNVGRMSLSNPLSTSNCERNEKSISEALQDSQISSYTLSEKEVPNDLQTKRRRHSSRKSSNSPIEKETKEKCYNLRKSSPNVSANILMKRKSVTFGENIYLSPSEDSSSSTPPDQTTTSEAKTKVTNSKINLNSGEVEHVFIRPEIPSQKSKEASGSMSKTSRSNLDDDSQTKSYDTSLDLSEIPKDKTILNRKVIFHSTPIRPALERKKFKSTYKSFENTLDQKGTHSDGLIKVSNEVSGTSSGGTSLRSSKNKRSNTFGSPKHKTSEISTSYSYNNKNVKRKTECPDKNSSKRKKVSTNKHIDTSLFSSTAVGDSLDSGSQFDSYKTVRFKQNVQFKDVRASSCSTEKYSYRNQSTPSEISGRSYHSGSMMSTLTSRNSNVSLTWEDESSKHVRFRDRHSVIDAPDSLHDFPSSPSTIGNNTPTSSSIHQPERQEIRLSINRTYDSETYRRLSPAKNKDELSQKLIKSTSNGNISVSSCGRETDSEYAISDCSAVREGMKYLIPFHIGPVRKVKKGLQLRNNGIFEESIFKKPKLQKYNFKNDPHFMINKQPYVEPKQKFPDKWVSKELYKFLIDKLKDSLDVNAHCTAERIIQYLCASVSSVEALNTPDDILLGTLLLRKLLVKHAICSNQLEYLSFIMRFTPFNFQKKILPLGKNLKVSDHVVPEAETIDINL